MKTKITKSIVFLCALTLTAFIVISILNESDPGLIGKNSIIIKNL